MSRSLARNDRNERVSRNMLVVAGGDPDAVRASKSDFARHLSCCCCCCGHTTTTTTTTTHWRARLQTRSAPWCRTSWCVRPPPLTPLSTLPLCVNANASHWPRGFKCVAAAARCDTFRPDSTAPRRAATQHETCPARDHLASINLSGPSLSLFYDSLS